MKILMLKSLGSGGFLEPSRSAFISSVAPSPAPDNAFTQELIRTKRVELVEDLGDESNYDAFMAEVERDPLRNVEDGLKRYREDVGAANERFLNPAPASEAPTKSEDMAAAKDPGDAKANVDGHPQRRTRKAD